MFAPDTEWNERMEELIRPDSLEGSGRTQQTEPAAAATKDTAARDPAKVAALWDETEEAMAIGAIIRNHEEVRAARRETLLLTLIALILFIALSSWAWRNIVRERVANANRAAGEVETFQPHGVNPER